MKQFKQQRGLSLVELMISMALGVFVIGGIFTVYVAISKSSADTLKQSRLNAEMSALMNIMVSDIRRAGYWEIDNGTGATIPPSAPPCVARDDVFCEKELDVYVPQDNPFSQYGTTALDVWDRVVEPGWDSADAVSVLPTGSGECILYTYDANRDGTVDDGTDDDSDGWNDPPEGFGFRLNGTGIDMRDDGNTSNDCALNEWAGIVDTNFIEVTALSFDLSNSQCINAAEPNEENDDAVGTVDDDIEKDCYNIGASTGDSTTEIREVLITLSARLLNDTLVTLTMSQTVRVRNDLIRVR